VVRVKLHFFVRWAHVCVLTSTLQFISSNLVHQICVCVCVGREVFVEFCKTRAKYLTFFRLHLKNTSQLGKVETV